MADVALVLLAGVLGAVVLAVVLLYRGQQRNRAIITQLNAEIAAQKIAALTQRGPNPLPAQDPEPARRKRHLSLHIGGGVAAFLASLGTRTRDTWTNHRAATSVTVTAAASVAVAGAFVLTSSSDTEKPALTAPSSAELIPHADPGNDSDHAVSDVPLSGPEAADYDPIAEAPAVTASGPVAPTPSPLRSEPAPVEPTLAPAAQKPSQRDTGTAPEATPLPPLASPTLTAWPTEPPAARPGSCKGLEVEAPPLLLDLCLR